MAAIIGQRKKLSFESTIPVNSKMPFKFGFIKRVFFCTIVLTIFMNSSEAQSQTSEISSPQELTMNWQYRVGDSPLDTSDTFIWANTDTTNTGWQSITYNNGVLEPPIQPDNGYLWLRVRLPAESWRAPHIFFVNTRKGCELYFGGQSVFSSGKIDAPSETNLAVPFWHMISLESDTVDRIL